MMYGELAEQNASYQTGHNTGSLRACGYMQNRFDEIVRENPRESIGKSVLLFPFFMLFSGLHIMIVKRKRMENRKYLVARSPFVK